MDRPRALNEIAKKTDGTNSNYFNNIDDRDLIIETGTSGFTNDVLSETSFNFI
jgi:hypothetical protein